MGSRDRRIVILGKTGVGKSSTGNTIFGGEAVFQTKSSPTSMTKSCEAEGRTIDGREITLIDPPGFFDTETPDEEQLKPEILKCIVECAPGPHAFLILFKVGKFTKQEVEVVQKIEEYFSPEALKYATVLFTHGYQLKGKTIEEFIGQNAELRALVEKCGGRCHVVDNKYWKKQQEGYTSNTFQVAELLSTIDKMVEENQDGCYTNEMLQAVDQAIQAEMEEMKEDPTEVVTEDKETQVEIKETKEEPTGRLYPEIPKELNGIITAKQMSKKAKKRVGSKLLAKCAGVATGALLGALLGVAVVAELSVSLLIQKTMQEPAATGGGAAAAAASIAAMGAATGGGLVAAVGGLLVGTAMLVGAVEGGKAGAEAAGEAESVGKAIKKAAGAARDKHKEAREKGAEFINKGLDEMVLGKKEPKKEKKSSKADSP